MLQKSTLLLYSTKTGFGVDKILYQVKLLCVLFSTFDPEICHAKSDIFFAQQEKKRMMKK